MADRTDKDTVTVPVHREGGRFPGWGGVNKHRHPEFLFPWEASDALNFTNRQGIQGHNWGVLSTRPGYSDSPKYQLRGEVDDNTFDYPSRLFAKYYPGVAEATDGKDVEFTGTGLNDLTVDTATSSGSIYELTISATGTPDEFDWTKDGAGGATGVAITGAGQQLGTGGPTVTFAATTGHTLADEFSIDPPEYIKQGVQVLRLAGTGATSVFQKYNKTTGGWDAITSNLNSGWYPQWLVWGIPTSPRFCWTDLNNGLHVYDGTTDVAQPIPKNSDSSSNITGALWLEQLDGRLIVSGNIFDANESLVVYYSGVGAPTNWQSHQNPPGGSFPLYAADSKSGESPPKHVLGLATLHGMLVVFTEDMRYVVTGIGTLGHSSREFPGAGCFNGKCIAKRKDRLYWAGKDGVFEWNGNEVINIGNPIYNDFYSLKLKAMHKFFSFVYEDQWWICAQKRDGTYVNYIYDFTTHNWYIWDIPMVAAFSTQTGLLDVGYLYFASPETVSDKYKHYVFGVDEATAGNPPVYADKITGALGSRTGTAIDWEWKTGRLDGRPDHKTSAAHIWKDHEAVVTRIGTAVTSVLSDNGSFTSARVDFNLNDETAFDKRLDMGLVQDTPFHSLSCRGDDGTNNTFGHYIQLRVTGSSTRRLDLKRVFLEFKPLAVPEHHT